MKKRNLIIVGLVLLLILVGGVYFWYLKEKPQVLEPEKKLIILTEEEKKNVISFLALSPNEIPDFYKDKIELYKEKLKNDCLDKKEEVKNFLLTNNDENILKEMKEITIALDLVSPKTTLEGEKVDFKINKQIIFECLDLNQNEFKNCQSELNGLEINNQNAENRVSEKIDIGRLIQGYLEWEAIKQSNENICQKLNLYNAVMGNYGENILNNCLRFTQIIRFATNVYNPASNCGNLCQKTDKIFGESDCLTACQAIKDSNINKCDYLKDTADKTICKAIISFEPNYCNDIVPRFVDSYEEGKLVKEDMVPICKRTMYMFNAIKQNKESLLGEAYKIFVGGGEIEYLDRIYFKKEISDIDFDEGYVNYCNLKYSL